jgi:TonB family protein
MMSTRTWIVPLLIVLSCPAKAQVAGESAAPTLDSVCLSEILINTPQPYDSGQIAAAQRKADIAREAIRQGQKFEDIAKKYSDGPSAGLGGALGLFKRGQLVKSMEDKVFAMKIGDVSDVIRTKQGFTILKVVECGPAGLGGVQDTTSDLGTPAGKHPGSIDILSDTQGVDFGPYIARIKQDVQENWYHLIPVSAEMRKGKLAIEFAITKNGQVADMRLVASSGDVLLDRPAWGAITGSSPFPPLPSQFTGPYLALRFRFYYNPDKSDFSISGRHLTDPIKGALPETFAKPKSAVKVSISGPSELRVPLGGLKTISALVTGTATLDNTVEWSISGFGCSGQSCGEMTKDTYQAPAVIPNPPFVTLTATSKTDPSVKASITVHIFDDSR